jgi:hypothetical protein
MRWLLYLRFLCFSMSVSALSFSYSEVDSWSYWLKVRGPFENFVDSLYYSESEICGVVVTVSFLKYLPWQAMHFLQRFTHFSKTCCRPFAASFRRIVEQAVLTLSWLEKPRNRTRRDLDCMADVLMGSHRSTFSKPNTEFSRATLTLH